MPSQAPARLLRWSLFLLGNFLRWQSLAKEKIRKKKTRLYLLENCSTQACKEIAAHLLEIVRISGFGTKFLFVASEKK